MERPPKSSKYQGFGTPVFGTRPKAIFKIFGACGAGVGGNIVYKRVLCHFASCLHLFAPIRYRKWRIWAKLGFCHIPNLAQLGIWQNPNFTKSHQIWSLDPPKGANMVQMALKHIYILYFCLRRRLWRRKKIFGPPAEMVIFGCENPGTGIFFFRYGTSWVCHRCHKAAM